MRYKPKPVSLEVYRRDVVIKYDHIALCSVPVAERGAITEFSNQARKRLAFVAANTQADFLVMVTLTYPSAYETSGKTVKRQLRAFLARLRRRYGQLSYLWALEFQARGAPHFHIWLTVDIPRDCYEQISAWWYEIVGSNDPKHLAAGTRVDKMRRRDGAARYAVKYAAKMRQKTVPENYRDVGRFFGYSRDVKPEPVMSDIRIESGAHMRQLFSGWKYKNRLNWNVFTTCYNAAGDVAAASIAQDLSKSIGDPNLDK